jgi:hypothetical protein
MAKLKRTDYRGLVELCQRGKGSATIGNNTTARLDGADIVVSLHGHDIVRMSADGDTAWTLAGWPTATTRERVNQFLPAGQRVFQHRGEQRQSWPRFPGDRDGWREVSADVWYRVSELVYAGEGVTA